MDKDEELDDMLDEDFLDYSEFWSNFILEWDRRRRMAAHMVCLVAAYLVKQSKDIDHMVINDDNFLEGFEGTYDMHDENRLTTPRESASNKSATSSHSKKRKTSSSIDFSRIEESMKEIALAIKEGNEILKKGIRERNEILQRTRPRVYSEDDVFNELVRLGIDSELLDRAYSFLIEKPGRMRAFFGNPVERRVRYLMTMLNGAGDS